MWKKKQVLEIDKSTEIYEKEIESLRKRNGNGNMLFKMGVNNDPETAYNIITESGKMNFTFLLTTLTTDEVHWIMSKTLEEVAKRAVTEAEITKIKLRSEIDPNFNNSSSTDK